MMLLEGGEFLLQFGDFFSQVFDYFIHNLLQFYKGLVEGVGLVVAVEYPAFELTLTNEEERVVARRVFLPDEYLPDATIIDEGLAGRGELAVRLFLDIGPLGAAGYRIYLFYPS